MRSGKNGVWVYTRTVQAEKYAWPRWESNLRPLEFYPMLLHKNSFRLST